MACSFGSFPRRKQGIPDCFGNAGAGIADFEPHADSVRGLPQRQDAELHGATLSELQGIADQVVDNLLDASRIPEQQVWDRVIAVELETDRLEL